MAEVLLRVSHLTKEFPLSRHEALRAVSDVSFSLAPGEIFGLVGESGSGKSTLARTISGLYRPTAGQVFLEDLEISQSKIYARHRPRIAHTLQFLFQDSMASLNPRQPIGALIEEPLAIHHEGTRQSRRETALGLMAQVGLRCTISIRRSFPAACASASALPVPWPCLPGLSSQTSPSLRWMFQCRRRSSICFNRCANPRAFRFCSSRMIFPWCAISAIASA